MRFTECLVALIVASSLSAGQGESPSMSLQDAERAFADALLRHDRAAFVALLAPDAECSLPVVKHGPDAIASAWLPFLIDPNTTMLFTNTGLTMAKSGDSGNTEGTFAIRGRTSKGIQTIPAGNYSIAWRLIDGHWKITALGGSAGRNGKTAVPGAQ